MTTYMNGQIDDHQMKCALCNHVFEDGDDMVAVDCGTFEAFICAQCFKPERYHVCDHCGRYFDLHACRAAHRFCGYDNPTHGICPTCYENGYHYCASCHTTSDELSDDNLCPQCEVAGELTRIHSHEYWPRSLTFHDTGVDRQIDGSCQLYLGFELEVEQSDSCTTTRSDMATSINRAEHSWCKSDGSLDCGFELVSHPMTLRYHLEKGEWRGVLNKLREGRYESYRTRTCGCHVHAARNYLTERRWRDISDVVNWDSEMRELYCAVAQRHGNEYAQFYEDLASEADMDEDNARADAVDGENRYMVVNFENTETIEFRLFKGTLKYESFISYLEFTDALVRYARFEATRLNMSRFMAYIREHAELYQELIDKLKRKGMWRDE